MELYCVLVELIIHHKTRLFEFRRQKGLRAELCGPSDQHLVKLPLWLPTWGFTLKTYKHTPFVCIHTNVEAEYIIVKAIIKNISILIHGTQRHSQQKSNKSLSPMHTSSSTEKFYYHEEIVLHQGVNNINCNISYRNHSYRYVLPSFNDGRQQTQAET